MIFHNIIWYIWYGTCRCVFYVWWYKHMSYWYVNYLQTPKRKMCSIDDITMTITCMILKYSCVVDSLDFRVKGFSNRSAHPYIIKAIFHATQYRILGPHCTCWGSEDNDRSKMMIWGFAMNLMSQRWHDLDENNRSDFT